MAEWLEGLGISGGLVVLTLVIAVLAVAGLRVLTALRRQAEQELSALYQRDVSLYLERLENNRLLGLVFRKPVLLLCRLEGYMKAGEDEKLRRTIAQLDGMRLAPRDRVQFYQDRLSYFASVGEGEEARASRDALADYLNKSGAAKEEKYRNMLADADQIIAVYIDRDTGLIPALREQAERADSPAQKGVLQYRLAKLCHFAGDEEMTQVYLKRAGKNLQNTHYEFMIKEALEDHAALERQ